MVLELLVSLPVVIATTEGVRHQTRQDHDEQQYRMKDFHIDVFCNAQSRKREQVNRTMVVLRGGKLYLAPRDSKTKMPLPLTGETSPLHPFTGFYLDYQPEKTRPDMFDRLNKPAKIRGLVSTISNGPPTLNWIYVDSRTQEVKYGGRADAEGQLLGPFDWTEDDEIGLVLEGWEGFVAVEEKKNLWAVYYDRDDNGLKSIIDGKRVLQCSLERRLIEEETEEVIRR